VAKRRTPDGHEIKVTKDGRIVRCTECEIHPYRELMDDDPALAARLEGAAKKLNSNKKSVREAARREFDEVSDELEKRLKQKRAAADADGGTDAAKQEAKKSKKKSGLLDENRKFKDKNTEQRYQAYRERKKVANARAKKAGRPKSKIRRRLDWKKASDWRRKHSPIARGNDFNATVNARGKYKYNEVTLSSGKRVDGYTPPTKGKPGQIVSRKATDLNTIDRATFDTYLNEMVTKYKPPQKITAPKYGEALKGARLKGKMILEVPDTPANRLAAEYRGFDRLAKSKGIELRFEAE
jgi:hypothetical protein